MSATMWQDARGTRRARIRALPCHCVLRCTRTWTGLRHVNCLPHSLMLLVVSLSLLHSNSFLMLSALRSRWEDSDTASQLRYVGGWVGYGNPAQAYRELIYLFQGQCKRGRQQDAAGCIQCAGA